VETGRGSVVTVPEVGWLPLQPPEAMQDCAFAEVHFKVAGLPTATAAVAAVKLKVGIEVLVALVVPASFSTAEPWPQAAKADTTISVSELWISRESNREPPIRLERGLTPIKRWLPKGYFLRTASRFLF
jgi:hypothetical protein